MSLAPAAVATRLFGFLLVVTDFRFSTSNVTLGTSATPSRNRH
jgi:hypothetical protein